MRLTTKGRFAVTAMLDIALQSAAPDSAGHEKTSLETSAKPITLADISERQDISLSYLEQLFSRLRRSGLVESVRGPGGGYRLAKPAEQICVSVIINAVDELIDATQCGGEENCKDDKRCMTHDLWTNLNARIFEYLSGISLADLVKNELEGKAKATNQPINFMEKPACNAQLQAA